MEADRELIDALRRGDERAFARVVDAYGASLLRVALGYAPSRTVAEEIVQETWLAVVRGLDGFEGRCSLRTWIFSILANVARTRGVRERRSAPFGDLGLDPDRLLGEDRHRLSGHAAFGPARRPTPEEHCLAGETRAVLLAAVRGLPRTQRAVIAMRDLEGCPAEQACAVLGLSDGNQRVLLHRARTKVRAALEAYLGAAETAARASVTAPAPGRAPTRP